MFTAPFSPTNLRCCRRRQQAANSSRWRPAWGLTQPHTGLCDIVSGSHLDSGARARKGFSKDLTLSKLQETSAKNAWQQAKAMADVLAQQKQQAGMWWGQGSQIKLLPR